MGLSGKTITDTRRVTEDELDEMNFPTGGPMPNPTVFVLDDGSFLFPSQDVELNDIGGWRGEFSSIENEKIEYVSPMTEEYMDYLGWSGSPPPVISFSNGEKVYPSQDSEGNGPGVLCQFDSGEVYEIVLD